MNLSATAASDGNIDFNTRIGKEGSMKFSRSSRPANVKRRTPVIADCIRALRSQIMQGNLCPGQKLVEADLCERLGVSRASIREALRILASERLIQLIPNRGPFVAKLGLQEIEDIHDVWALLTGKAVFLFTDLAKPENYLDLENALKDLKEAVSAKNSLDQLAATNLFFGSIIAFCGNGVLIEFIESLVSRINFLRAQAFQHEGWGLLYVQEIETILDKIRARQPEAARKAAERHIDSACTAAKQMALASVGKHASQHGKAARALANEVQSES